MATFSDLVQRTIVELRQEPGVSVEQYAEDIIAAIMQRMFNTFFDHYWWPGYLTNGEVMTLNGVDGRVTTDLTKKIRRINDLRYIWYESETRPLAVMPPMLNPATSIYRKYYDTVPDEKIFKIVPPTTTGVVRVSYRTKPDPFIPKDEVKLDDDLLITATAFNYLADDEDNQAAVKKFAEAASKREGQLREVFNKGPISFGSSGYSPLTEWMG